MSNYMLFSIDYQILTNFTEVFFPLEIPEDFPIGIIVGVVVAVVAVAVIVGVAFVVVRRRNR